MTQGLVQRRAASGFAGPAAPLPPSSGAAGNNGPIQRKEDPTDGDAVTLEFYQGGEHEDQDLDVPSASSEVENQTLIAALRESGVDALGGSVVALQPASGTVPGLESSDVQPLREAIQGLAAAALEMTREELARKLGYEDQPTEQSYCQEVEPKESVGQICDLVQDMLPRSSPRVVWESGEEEPCDERWGACAECGETDEPCEACAAEKQRREGEECTVCAELTWGKDQIAADKRDETNRVYDVSIFAARPTEEGGLPPALLLTLDIHLSGDTGGAVERSHKLTDGALAKADQRVRIVVVYGIDYKKKGTVDDLDAVSAAIVVEGPIPIDARDDDLEGLTKQIKKAKKGK